MFLYTPNFPLCCEAAIRRILQNRTKYLKRLSNAKLVKKLEKAITKQDRPLVMDLQAELLNRLEHKEP